MRPAADTRSFSQNVCYVSSSPSTQPSRSSSISFTTRAGTPATTVWGGTSFVTTAPAATTAPRRLRW